MLSETDKPGAASPQPTPEPAAKASRRRHIIDISAITAIASLVVALVFNGIQVRDSADQARASRQATELGLMTQLNEIVAQAESSVSPLDREFRQAELHYQYLSFRTAGQFAVTLKNLDYLAWLYNHGYVAIPGARQLWEQRMKCMYATAVLIYTPKYIYPRLPNLRQFVGNPSPSSLTRIRNKTC